MLPQINLFGYDIAMYGLMIVVGVSAGIIVGFVRAKITGHSREDLVFASMYAAIGVVIAAKLLYLLTILPYIVTNFNDIIKSTELIKQIMSGGFVFYGGVIGGAVGALIYCRVYKLDVLSIVDALTPSIPITHMFGRLGCFFAGCCYGIEFTEPIGMYFDRSPYAPHDVTLFSVQLAEATCNLLIFVVLIVIGRKRRKRGVVFGSYLLMYTVARFVIEYFRGDEHRGILFGLSTSQWISIPLFAIGLILILTARKRSKTVKPE